MKKWQSILAQLGILVATGLVSTQVHDDSAKGLALAGIGTLSAFVSHKTSESKPDGTPVNK
jgi:hypothetical protein